MEELFITITDTFESPSIGVASFRVGNLTLSMLSKKVRRCTFKAYMELKCSIYQLLTQNLMESNKGSIERRIS